MRTKTLLLTTVLGIVGASAAMAQTNVYSANAVGYVNLTISPGFALIANQLDNNGTNTLAALLPDAPDGTTIYKFNGTGYTVAVHDTDWGTGANTTLNPGEGAFVKVNATTTLTFVGNVMSGTLTNNVPAGFSIRSSMVPQQGVLDTDLKFPAVDGDTVYRYDTTAKGYVVSTYDGGFPTPSKVTVGVGEAFFVKKNVAANWVRTFDPNSP